jgi:VanZ family protein
MSRFRNYSYRTLLIASGTVLGIYWIILFVMTHLPPEILSRVLFSLFSGGDEVLEQGGDKRMHLLAYAGLAFLFTSWLWIRGADEFKLWTLTIVVLSGYAVLDELLQIPFGRNADFRDCLADWTGIAMGSLCFLAVRLLLGRFGVRHTSASAEAS